MAEAHRHWALESQSGGSHEAIAQRLQHGPRSSGGHSLVHRSRHSADAMHAYRCLALFAMAHTALVVPIHPDELEQP